MRSIAHICYTALLVGLSVPGLAQTQSIEGKWKGEWSNEHGHRFTFILDIGERDGGTLKGAFIWRLEESPRFWEQKKLGKTAVEYVDGEFDAKNNILRLTGTGKSDPHLIIGIDRYDLQLSPDFIRLNGITENHGDWQGIFHGERLPKL